LSAAFSVEYRIRKTALSLQRVTGSILAMGGLLGLFGPVFTGLSQIPESEPALAILGKIALISWPYWIMLIAGFGFMGDAITAETIRFEEEQMVLVRRTLGIASVRRFEAAGMLDPRHVRGFAVGGMAWDWMAFWYKGHDIRFGDGIGAAEAERLLAWMQATRPEIFYERGEADARAGEADTLH
jgi:hypothetical protein